MPIKFQTIEIKYNISIDVNLLGSATNLRYFFYDNVYYLLLLLLLLIVVEIKTRHLFEFYTFLCLLFGFSCFIFHWTNKQSIVWMRKMKWKIYWYAFESICLLSKIYTSCIYWSQWSYTIWLTHYFVTFTFSFSH